MPLHSLAKTTRRRRAGDALLVFLGCHHFSCPPKVFQGCSARLLPTMKNFTLSGSLGRDPRQLLAKSLKTWRPRQESRAGGRLGKSARELDRLCSTTIASREEIFDGGLVDDGADIDGPARSIPIIPKYSSTRPLLSLHHDRDHLVERCVSTQGPTPRQIVNKPLQVKRCRPKGKNVMNSRAALVAEVSAIHNG